MSSKSDLALSIRGLSKSYTIAHGALKRPTFREVCMDRLQHPFRKPQTETFWALNDISFDVKKGEVVGIIGRNGAGKSTLLKILSRITEPTSGEIDVYGRIGSLLEVGTGFHPELTGRENIYLNGAILGMRRAEIAGQFDEIVNFAEVEKFLDTPVKRYSSGMYVRLAFAVAAHLRSEILIVDEVLAVGDVEFQKRCLGKMKDVASGGRTVLFVSHNMHAVAQLTQSSLVLKKGQVVFNGMTKDALLHYLRPSDDSTSAQAYTAADSKLQSYVASAHVRTSHNDGIHQWGRPLIFDFDLEVKQSSPGLCFSFQILNAAQQAVCHFWLYDTDVPFGRLPGTHRLRCLVPRPLLFQGEYSLTTWLADRPSGQLLESLQHICNFKISMHEYQREQYGWQADECVFLERAEWQLSPSSDSRTVRKSVPEPVVCGGFE